jgi:dienelactone hydrolase
MAHILLLHSVLGLRAVEHGLAAEWRAAGHDVTLPDLYAGHSAESYDAGFALLDRIGLDTVTARALAAARPLPRAPVLAGISMGAGLAARAWADRPDASAILFLCGPGPWPANAARGTPVEMHAARPDPFDDEATITRWQADNPGAALALHRYDGAGHFFLDPTLPDHDAGASRRCRAAIARVLAAATPAH